MDVSLEALYVVLSLRNCMMGELGMTTEIFFWIGASASAFTKESRLGFPV